MARKKVPSRGGFRVGSGRKTYKEKEGEDLVRKTVTLPVSQVEYLTRLGAGNLSAGIRQLVEEKLETPADKPN